MILRLRGFVVLSGYPDPVYDEVLRAWRRIEVPHFNNRGHQKTEILWLNFGPVA